MKQSRGKGITFLVFVFTSALTVNGCCYFNTLRPLEKAKDLAGKQDYASAANLEIKCDDSCEGCNQLHLVKGDACYRLAKNGQEPLKHYACAAGDLTEGIGQTRDWSNLGRTQTYINLCESLRNWEDLSSGAAADSINERLLTTAGQFLAAEPGNACGVYYQNTARYAKLRPCQLHPENCPTLCTQLDGISQSVSVGLAKAGPAECGPQLKELKSNLDDAKKLAGCQ